MQSFLLNCPYAWPSSKTGVPASNWGCIAYRPLSGQLSAVLHHTWLASLCKGRAWPVRHLAGHLSPRVCF